jgi:hypothetical protein
MSELILDSYEYIAVGICNNALDGCRSLRGYRVFLEWDILTIILNKHIANERRSAIISIKTLLI